MKKYFTNYVLELAYKEVFQKLDTSKQVDIHNIIELTSGKNLPKSKMEEGKYMVYGGGGETDKTHNVFNIDFQTLGIGRVGARCGCTFKINPFSWVTDNALYAKKIDDRFDLDFLIHYLNYCKLNKYANNSLQPVISKSRISNVQIPIVSKNIQLEIGKMLNGIENDNIEKKLVEKYRLQKTIFFEKNWIHLSNNIKTQQLLISQLQQAILQEAVQGKLLPQNPDDEPASELLQRIKAEKAALVKAKKIKKEKPLPPIEADEIPFELPKGWVWCRLGEICELITSGSRGWAKYYSKKGAKFIRMGNLSKGSLELRLTNIQYVNLPVGKIEARAKLQEYDYLMSITGDVGMLGLIPKDFGDAYINQHTGMIRLINEIRNHFWGFLLLSPVCQTQFNAVQRGIKNSFRLTDIELTVIPLPPLSEQHRIVAKVESLLGLCENLSKQVGQSQVDAEVLMQAVLQEAFGK